MTEDKTADAPIEEKTLTPPTEPATPSVVEPAKEETPKSGITSAFRTQANLEHEAKVRIEEDRVRNECADFNASFPYFLKENKDFLNENIMALPSLYENKVSKEKNVLYKGDTLLYYYKDGSNLPEYKDDAKIIREAIACITDGDIYETDYPKIDRAYKIFDRDLDSKKKTHNAEITKKIQRGTLDSKGNKKSIFDDIFSACKGRITKDQFNEIYSTR